MNKVILMGRLTRDPEIRYSQTNNIPIATYTLAVDRLNRNGSDGPTADFLRCISFQKSAEFAEQYLRKGIKIAVTGRIQTGSYTNRDGQKVYTTDVIVEQQEFAESKRSAAPAPEGRPDQFSGNPINIPDGIGEEFLFN